MELLPGCAVSILPGEKAVEALEAAMRRGEPPIIGRVDHGRYLLHMRTLCEEDYPCIAQRAKEALL